MNIVVVMLDSLRSDFMGCYGNPDVETPYMDAIAARGRATPGCGERPAQKAI